MSQDAGNDSGLGGLAGFLSHLIELRDRLLRAVLLLVVVGLLLFPFADTLYTWMAGPLLAHLPEGSSMIATEVASPFLIPLKVVLLLTMVLTAPYWLYQLWAFVAPGLYQHEKRLAMPLLVSTDIAKYLDFITALFFAFGLAFEVPVAVVLLVTVGVVRVEQLQRARPYVIVGAFVVGMVLTPPDVFSQTLLAIPVWLLYEIGIVVARMLRREATRAAAPEGEGEGDGALVSTYGAAAAAVGAAAHAEARVQEAQVQEAHVQEAEDAADAWGAPPRPDDTAPADTAPALQAPVAGVQSPVAGSDTDEEPDLDHELNAAILAEAELDRQHAREVEGVIDPNPAVPSTAPEPDDVATPPTGRVDAG